jgi:hypothetical protein
MPLDVAIAPHRGCYRAASWLLSRCIVVAIALHRGCYRAASWLLSRCVVAVRCAGRSTRGAASFVDLVLAATDGSPRRGRVTSRSTSAARRRQPSRGAHNELALTASAACRYLAWRLRDSEAGRSRRPIKPWRRHPTFRSHVRGAKSAAVGGRSSEPPLPVRHDARHRRGSESGGPAPEPARKRRHPSNHSADEYGSMPSRGTRAACFRKLASTYRMAWRTSRGDLSARPCQRSAQRAPRRDNTSLT